MINKRAHGIPLNLPNTLCTLCDVSNNLSVLCISGEVPVTRVRTYFEAAGEELNYNMIPCETDNQYCFINVGRAAGKVSVDMFCLSYWFENKQFYFPNYSDCLGISWRLIFVMYFIRGKWRDGRKGG